MANDIVIGGELGPEFSIGGIQANKIRLKLGSGITIQPDGSITSALLSTTDPTLGYTTSVSLAGGNTVPIIHPPDNGDFEMTSVLDGNGGGQYTFTHTNSDGIATQSETINVPAPSIIPTDQGGFDSTIGLLPDGTLIYSLNHTNSSGTVENVSITVPPAFTGPWDNANTNIPADQTSTNIKYNAGNVGISVENPLAQLHVGPGTTRQDFTASGGVAAGTAYLQRANDGTGNFHKYWNTEGTATPTRLDVGYALGELYTASSPWYIIRGSGTDVAGTPIAWSGIHQYNMATGQHRFDQYGQGTFDDAAPARLLGTQANGTIVEVDPSTVGGKEITTVDLGLTDGCELELNIIEGGTQFFRIVDLSLLTTCLENKVAEIGHIAAYTLSGDGNANNVNIALTSVREDTGWTSAANAATWGGITLAPNGSIDRVEITAQVYYDPPNSNLLQRIAPVVNLLKNGVVVATAASGYQRHATGHNDSSNTIVFMDVVPTTGDVWTLQSQQGSLQGDVLPITRGQLTFKTIERFRTVARN